MHKRNTENTKNIGYGIGGSHGQVDTPEITRIKNQNDYPTVKIKRRKGHLK